MLTTMYSTLSAWSSPVKAFKAEFSIKADEMEIVANYHGLSFRFTRGERRLHPQLKVNN